MLVSAGNDGAIHCWRAGNGSEVRVLLGHTAPITALAFHPDGAVLLSSSSDGTVRLWAVPGPTRVLVELGTSRSSPDHQPNRSLSPLSTRNCINKSYPST
jgi:WD40 repeat protein